MVSMHDLYDELEILGEVDLDDSPHVHNDNEDDEDSMPSRVFSDANNGPSSHHHQDSRDSSVASINNKHRMDHWVAGQPAQDPQMFDSQESERLAKLAQDLGHAGVKMIIGAFR